MRYRFQLAAIVAMTSSAAFADDESVTFCVENYGGTGECTGSDVPDACDVEGQWDFAVGYISGWDLRVRYNNKGVDESDFEDPTADEGATGIDWADIALFVGRGGRPTSSCTSAFISVGDSASPECDVEIEQFEMDGDLDMAVLFSSNSNQLCIADSEYGTIPSTNQFNLLNGFHGNTSIYTSDHFRPPYFILGIPVDNPSVMREFIDSSVSGDWGDNWLLHFTMFGSGSDYDRCATSTIWADTNAEEIAIAEGGGFMDRVHFPFTTSVRYRSLDGCDPADGGAL